MFIKQKLLLDELFYSTHIVEHDTVFMQQRVVIKVLLFKVCWGGFQFFHNSSWNVLKFDCNEYFSTSLLDLKTYLP